MLDRIRARSAQAIATGALEPIATTSVAIDDGGIRFRVHCMSNLKRKLASKQTGRPANPLLNYDSDFFVESLTDTHLCLLNKFPVYENHVLIVTAQFEEQQAPLSIRDFEALCICLRNVDGLAFYNAGPAAGASQTHRHLQLVPLSGQQIPMEAAFTRAVESGARHAALPFRHRLARLNFEQGAAEAHQALSVYLDLLSETGLIADPAELPERTPPYNLLCTRRWMMVCPRSREVSGSISINALGFAGTLLVSDPAELAEVKARGPMALLKEVAVESS